MVKVMRAKGRVGNKYMVGALGYAYGSETTFRITR
jgi:hypothetical protein